MLAGEYWKMGGSRICGDGMYGESLAGLCIRSSVAMLSGVSDVATDLVVDASELLKVVLTADESDVDK